jgi:hypothetical protein
MIPPTFADAVVIEPVCVSRGDKRTLRIHHSSATSGWWFTSTCRSQLTWTPVSLTSIRSRRRPIVRKARLAPDQNGDLNPLYQIGAALPPALKPPLRQEPRNSKNGQAMNIEQRDGFFVALIAGRDVVPPSE